MVQKCNHTCYNIWALLITFVKGRSHPLFAEIMVDHWRLVAISTVDLLFLLLLSRLALCEDRSSLLEVLPISLPPSELWYVVQWASKQGLLSLF